mgnify:FL=1|nr:MAG TPA: type I neck protein [Caudoviricetes sp.]
MISFRQKGDFSKTLKYLDRIRDPIKMGILDKYGREGVKALSSATPVDSGVTSNSWYYKIEKDNKSAKVVFYNSHINKGVSIAIILQYGHGTGTGGWVQGRDYINPAVRPIFDKMANEIWREVTRV